MNFDTYFANQDASERLRRLFTLEITRHVLPLTTNNELKDVFKWIGEYSGPLSEMGEVRDAVAGVIRQLIGIDVVSYWLARGMEQLIHGNSVHRVAWPMARAVGTFAEKRALDDPAHDFVMAQQAEEGYQIHLAFCLLEERPSVNLDYRSLKGLAQTILEERDFALMPILGDALGEMGECEMEAHTREKVHGPGCWVLDRILGLRN